MNAARDRAKTVHDPDMGLFPRSHNLINDFGLGRKG
jgi:hypothetical protein